MFAALSVLARRQGAARFWTRPRSVCSEVSSQSALSPERGGSTAGLSEFGDSDSRFLSSATQEDPQSSAALSCISSLELGDSRGFLELGDSAGFSELEESNGFSELGDSESGTVNTDHRSAPTWVFCTFLRRHFSNSKRLRCTCTRNVVQWLKVESALRDKMTCCTAC